MEGELRTSCFTCSGVSAGFEVVALGGVEGRGEGFVILKMERVDGIGYLTSM